MLIGFGAPVSGAWAGADNLVRFGERAERLGYHSLWTFTRLLAPADNSVDPVYRSVLDPIVALSYLAARTDRIRLGVAVVNLPFVSPAYLGKQAATLDLLSAGRLDLGLGLGWSPEEFTASGASRSDRGARTGEYLAALRTLWTDEVSEYAGRFYTIPPSRMAPKPARPGGPPVLLGGSAPAALRRAGRLADGWITRSAHDLSRIDDDIAVIREAAQRAGRDPAAIRVVCRGVLRIGERRVGEDGRPLLLSGSYQQIRADLDWLDSQGVTETFLDLNWDPLIGSPDVEPGAATRRAEEIMEALAPGGR
jgi:probable F420-dependent oxidoreductase